MSDDPQKPRKVSDLKARLGRTIAPSTVSAGSGDIAPPPNLGGVVPPPSNVGGMPGPMLGTAKPKVEAPPMVQAQQAAAAEEEERRKKKKADPFAAGFVSGRLVLAFDVPPEVLRRWRESAGSSEAMEGGLRRFALAPGWQRRRGSLGSLAPRRRTPGRVPHAATGWRPMSDNRHGHEPTTAPCPGRCRARHPGELQAAHALG